MAAEGPSAARQSSSRVAKFRFGDREVNVQVIPRIALRQREDPVDLSDLGEHLPTSKRGAKRVIRSILERRIRFRKVVRQTLAEIGKDWRGIARKREEELASYASGGCGWVCVDCSFDDLMTQSELVSLRDQLTRCWGAFRDLPRGKRPALVVTSVTDDLLVLMLEAFAFPWPVRLTRTSFSDLSLGTTATPGKPSPIEARDLRDTLFDDAGRCLLRDPTRCSGPALAKVVRTIVTEGQRSKQPEPSAEAPKGGSSESGATELGAKESQAAQSSSSSSSSEEKETSVAVLSAMPVESQPLYLSADASVTLSSSDDCPWPTTGTVLGGLVDRNRHTGVALRRAKETGAQPVQLPLAAFAEKGRTSVLTVVAVVQIVTGRLTGRGWHELLEEALPKRKGKRLPLRHLRTGKSDSPSSSSSSSSLSKDEEKEDGAGCEKRAKHMLD